jgi:membrane-associated protease RseP (regulator of RpoE activity)
VVRLAAVVGGIVALAVWRGAVPTLVIVAAVIVMITLHELGHYLTAKWGGMKVTEFFIGFGPRLWSTRRGETEYGVKAIPAGAYVRIIGMNNLDPVDPADESRTYRQQPYWRRMSVALAGSAMHFLIALALVFTLFVGWGTYTPDRWSVGTLSTLAEGVESPAQQAGIELGDRILEVDGRPVGDFDDLRSYLAARPGQEVALLIERDGRTLTLTPRLADRNPGGEPAGFLGVGPRFEQERLSPVSAAVESVQATGKTMWLSVRALGSFFTPDGLGDFFAGAIDRPEAGSGETAGGDGRVISIVGAVRIGSQAAENGPQEVLEFLWLINIFIGIFNLVPLLPLDGGHVAIATYERLRSRGGRRHFADVSKLLPLTYAVVVLMVVVGVTALYLDLAAPIGNPYD